MFSYKYNVRDNRWTCSYDDEPLFSVSDEEVHSYAREYLNPNTIRRDAFKALCDDVILRRAEGFANQFVVRSFLHWLFK